MLPDPSPLASILERLPAPVICAQASGEVLLANRAARSLLRLPALPGHARLDALLAARPGVAIAASSEADAGGCIVHTLREIPLGPTAAGALEAILEGAPMGVALLDADLRLLRVNAQLARLDGRSVEDHLGRSIEALFSSRFGSLASQLRTALEQGLDEVRCDLSLEPLAALQGAEARFLEVVFRPMRGEDGALCGVLALVADETPLAHARRRIEGLAAAEQTSAAELLALLQADPNGIALFGPDDRLRCANAPLAAQLGVSDSELVGRHFSEIMERCAEASGLVDPQRVLARTRELFAQRGLALTDELELTRPRRSLCRSSTPIVGPGETYLGRLLVHVDVTSAREVDRERSEFLTVASHELKTPLTPLAIGLQAIERRLAAGQPIERELVAKARRQLGRLNALIDDLLDFSRMESGRLPLRVQPLALEALVAEVISDLRASAPMHDIRLAHDGPLWIEGDPLRLEQVLVNLIQNAVKYSPSGGAVEVRIERLAGEASISVRDDGIGIPEADHDHLFERFFRAQNATARHFGGLGIGLHVSREIVQRHGGRFEVESAPYRGSTFRFFLPLAAAAPTASTPPAP